MNNMRQAIFPAAALVCCAATTPALAVDVGSDTKVGGLVFFDVSNISLQNEDKTGKKVDTPPNGFGFDIKRFYLIVDHKFNDVWSANLTTDAQYSTAATTTVVTPAPAGGSEGTVNALTGQNTSGGVTEVMIKKLYLQGKFARDLTFEPVPTTVPGHPSSRVSMATDTSRRRRRTAWALPTLRTGASMWAVLSAIMTC